MDGLDEARGFGVIAKCLAQFADTKCWHSVGYRDVGPHCFEQPSFGDQMPRTVNQIA
jgi:hypothetical protein